MDLAILNCLTFKSRFFGFMGVKEIKKILCFPRCNSVHTFFMKANIDIYMTDNTNNILYVYKNVGKNRIIFPRKGVYFVYETPVGYDLRARLKKK